MKEKSVMRQIREGFTQFTKTQKKIADYICDNYRQIPAMSVQELAQVLDTSDATIIRFAQTLGYKGYLEMRSALKMEDRQYWAPYTQFSRRMRQQASFRAEDENKSAMEMIAANDMECHREFYETFDRSLLDAVVKEINRAETVHIAGFGIDSLIADFLNWYLTVMGYRTVCYTDGGFATARKFSNVKENDLLILLITPRLLKVEKSVLAAAKNRGAHIVCIAQGITLEISSLCTITLTLPDRANELINSYVTYMSLCNMLIIALYKSKETEIAQKLKDSEDMIHFFDLLL